MYWALGRVNVSSYRYLDKIYFLFPILAIYSASNCVLGLGIWTSLIFAHILLLRQAHVCPM